MIGCVKTIKVKNGNKDKNSKLRSFSLMFLRINKNKLISIKEL